MIGLNATPKNHTFGFVKWSLVVEHHHEQAVADGVKGPFDVHQIKARITRDGAPVEAGQYVDKRDRESRATRWERLGTSILFAWEAG